jgi:hypothetical protein
VLAREVTRARFLAIKLRSFQQMFHQRIKIHALKRRNFR